MINAFIITNGKRPEASLQPKKDTFVFCFLLKLIQTDRFVCGGNAVGLSR
jgi:hypothetical protein